MDINDNQQMNVFLGGMNTDVSDTLLKPEQYRLAKNLRLLTNKDANTCELRMIDGTEELFDQEFEGGEVLKFDSVRNLMVAIVKHEGDQSNNIPDTWRVYTSTIGELQFTPVTGYISEPIWDKDGNANLSIVLNYESEANIYLYIADGIHQIMKVDLNGSESQEFTDMTNNIFYQLPLPSVQIVSGGFLPSGKIYYQYYLYNQHINSHGLSFPSKTYSIYKDANSGYQTTKTSNSSANIQIGYDSSVMGDKTLIRVFRINYTQQDQPPVVDVVYDDIIHDHTNNIINIVDSGRSIQSYSFAEYISLMSNINIIPKHIYSKDNYMFAGNIQYQDFSNDENIARIKNNVETYFKIVTENDTVNPTIVNQYREKTFMPNDDYKFGIVLYGKDGSKSDVIPYPDLIKFTGDYNLLKNINGFYVPKVKLQLKTQDNEANADFVRNNFSKVELVRAERKFENKSIISQGILGHTFVGKDVTGENGTQPISLNKICPAGFVSMCKVGGINGAETELKTLQFVSPDVLYDTDQIYTDVKNNIDKIKIENRSIYVIDGTYSNNNESQPENIAGTGIVSSSLFSDWDSRFDNNDDTNLILPSDIDPNAIVLNLQDLINVYKNDITVAGLSFRYGNAVDNIVLNLYEMSSTEQYSRNNPQCSQLRQSTGLNFPEDGYIESSSENTNNLLLDLLEAISNRLAGPYKFIILAPANQQDQLDYDNQSYELNKLYRTLARQSNNNQNNNNQSNNNDESRPYKFTIVNHDTHVITTSGSNNPNCVAIAEETGHYTGNMDASPVFLNICEPNGTYPLQTTTQLSVTIDSITDCEKVEQPDPISFSEGEKITIFKDVNVIGGKEYINWVIPYQIRLNTEDSRFINFFNAYKSTVANFNDYSYAYPLASGGKCLLLSSPADTYTVSSRTGVFPISIVDLTKTAVPYDDSPTYYSFGDIIDLDKGETFVYSTSGDTFFQVMEYNAAHTFYAPMYQYLTQMAVIYRVPLFSNIDMSAEYGTSFTKQSGAHYFIQDIPTSFPRYSQTQSCYLQDGAYNYTNPAITAFEKHIDDREINSNDCRIFYSQQKGFGEILDNWLVFKSADFIDLDYRYGQITNISDFKNNLVAWQENATAFMQVNERAIVNDITDTNIILGTANVLQRYDYITTIYGMKEGHDSYAKSDTILYWWDEARKEILANGGDRTVIPLILSKSVSNLLNTSTIKQNNPKLMYDIEYKELIANIFSTSSLVYSEAINQFTSIYDIIINHHTNMSGNNIICNDNSIYKWNSHSESDDNDYSYPVKIYNAKVKPKLTFLVNKLAQQTKVYDNMLYNGDFYGGPDREESVYDNDLTKVRFTNANLDPVVFSFKTPLNQYAAVKAKDVTTIIENDYRMCIPRSGRSENLNLIKYGNRMRGKTMECTIESNSNNHNFSIQYVITKYRTSWT